MKIEKEIQKLRNQYIKEDSTPNFYEINNGLCEKFAMDLLKKMGGYSDDCYELCNENFMIGENGEEDENDIWDENLLETHWNIKPVCNLTWKQINMIPFGSHVWLYYRGKHYDAECSEGVVNFFELPLFKRYIIDYCKEKNIFHKEFVTMN